MKEKITIVIPTHKRSIVNRALSYYGKWDVRLIVCDSSSSPLKLKSSNNILYLHTPEKGFSQKMSAALGFVKTPFCCISADDDFLSHSGMQGGIEFLEENQDYVSVQGRYIEFTKSGNNVYYTTRYANEIGHHNNSDIPSERIISAFNPYVQYFYSLHRTSVLQKSFDLASHLKSLIHAELSPSLVGMIYGKHKILPLFWMARDRYQYTPYSSDSSGGNNSSVISGTWNNDGWKLYLLSDEAKYHKELFAKEFSEVTGESIDVGNEVFEQAFEAFLDGIADSSKVQLSWKDTLSKMIPNVLLEWRRTILYSPLKRQNQSINTYRKTPGFPWSDVHADADWQNMKSVIVKFDFSPNQETSEQKHAEKNQPCANNLSVRNP